MRSRALVNSLRGLTWLRYIRSSGVVFRKYTQVSSRDGETRLATIRADQKLWIDPDDGFVDIFQSGRMDGNLRYELAMVIGTTKGTCHGCPLPTSSLTSRISYPVAENSAVDCSQNILIAAGHNASIDIPDGTRDPRGLFGQQHGNDFRDVFRFSDAADGVEPVETLKNGSNLVLRQETLENWSIHNGGRHRINPNVCPCQFQREV